MSEADTPATNSPPPPADGDASPRAPSRARRAVTRTVKDLAPGRNGSPPDGAPSGARIDPMTGLPEDDRPGRGAPARVNGAKNHAAPPTGPKPRPAPDVAPVAIRRRRAAAGAPSGSRRAADGRSGHAATSASAPGSHADGRQPVPDQGEAGDAAHRERPRPGGAAQLRAGRRSHDRAGTSGGFRRRDAGAVAAGEAALPSESDPGLAAARGRPSGCRPVTSRTCAGGAGCVTRRRSGRSGAGEPAAAAGAGSQHRPAR